MIEKSPISTVSEKILTSWFDGKIFWLPLFCYHGDIYKLIFAVTSCWYVLPKFLHSKPISKWISNLAILNVKCYIRCLFTIETALKRANLSYLTIWNPEMAKVCYHLSDLTKNHLCWCYDFTEIFTMQFLFTFPSKEFCIKLMDEVSLSLFMFKTSTCQECRNFLILNWFHVKFPSLKILKDWRDNSFHYFSCYEYW